MQKMTYRIRNLYGSHTTNVYTRNVFCYVALGDSLALFKDFDSTISPLSYCAYAFCACIGVYFAFDVIILEFLLVFLRHNAFLCALLGCLMLFILYYFFKGLCLAMQEEQGLSLRHFHLFLDHY